MPMFPSFFRRTKDSRKKGSKDRVKDTSLSGSERTGNVKETSLSGSVRTGNVKDTTLCGSERTFSRRAEQDLPCQNSPKLVWAGNARGQGNREEPESVDVSRRLLCSGDRSTDVTAGYFCPSQAASPPNSTFRLADIPKPLPLPPRQSVPLLQPGMKASIRSPLPLRTGDSRDGDGVLGLSGYPTDSDSSDCSSESGIGREFSTFNRRNLEGEALRLQHSSMLEDSQRFTSHYPVHSSSRADGTQPGSPVGAVASPRLAFRNSQGEGGDFHLHIHVNGVQNSASTSTFSSPVLSPRGMGHQEQQPWLWNPASNHLQQTSSPTSGNNSGHNSISNDFPLQQRRQSSDLSPRTQSSAVSPRHPLSNSTAYESSWNDSHPLPHPSTSGGGTAPSTPLSPRSAGVPPRSPCKSEPGPSAGRWQKGRLLGSGSFGKVFKGIHSETGEFCAIKEVEFLRDDPKSQESAKQLAQEIMLLSSLRHPNIVHYKGSEMVGGNLYIYLELVSGGSIYKLYQEFTRLQEPVIRRYTRQILQGLHFLHSKSTVHRDIKGANILVDQDGTVKLADFGMAKHVKEQGVPLSFKGSPYWMAPEVIMQRNTGYEFAVDIWSLGCTVIEMVTGKPPWSEYEGVAAMFKVTRAEAPPIPEGLSPEGQSFIRFCLQKNPAERPPAAFLLDHPFVQIPNDGPELMPHALNMPDFLDVGERSIRLDSEGSSRGFSRAGVSQYQNSRESHAPARPGMFPSISAPVSPRSSYQTHGGLIPTRSAGILPGYATPPTGPPGSSTGIDLYTSISSHSNASTRRAGRPLARHGMPTSLHVTVNGPDAQWGIIAENGPMPQTYGPPTSNGFYMSGNSRSPRERSPRERESGYPQLGALQRMDERVTQVLREKSPQNSPRYHVPTSSMGSTAINRTRSHEVNS